jgi:hypothetical protein
VAARRHRWCTGGADQRRPGSVAGLPPDASDELVAGIDVATAEVRVVCVDGAGGMVT